MSKSETNPTPNPAPTPRPKLNRRQKWYRRTRRTLVGLIVAAVLLRVALALLLPTALRKAAEFYGLDFEYGRAKLGLTGGYAGLWDVVVTPKEGGEPVFKAQYCGANISIWALLHGQLIVWRVDADGVELNLERTGDGRILILEKLATAPAKAKQAAQAKAPGKVVDLTAPLQVEAFRLTRMQANISDLSVSPAFKAMIGANLRVSDIGADKIKTHIELDAWSDQLFTSIRILGDGHSVGREVTADFRMSAIGINPTVVQAYLRALGIRALGKDMGMTAHINITTTGVENTLDAFKGQAKLSNIRVFAGDRDAFSIKSMVAIVKYVSAERLDLGTVAVSDAKLFVGRASDGALAFNGLEFGSMPAAATQAATTRPARATSQVAVISAPTTLEAAWPKLSLDELLIKNVAVEFADEAVAGNANMGMVLKTLRLTNLSTYGQAAARSVELAAELSADGIAKSIKIVGKADPFAVAKNGQFSFRISGIRLDAIKPYFDALGIESTLKDAAFNFDLSTAFGEGKDGALQGEVKLNDLSLTDSQNLLKLTDARITGCRIDLKTLEVAISAIDLAGPKLLAYRDKQGRLSLLGFRTKSAVTPDGPPLSTSTQPSLIRQEGQKVVAKVEVNLPIPRITIDRFTWKDIQMELQDDSLTPPKKLAITDAGLELTNLAVELRPTTRPASPGTLHAWLKFPGVVGSVDLAGTLTATPSALKVVTDVKADAINGEALRPYLEPLGMEMALTNASLRLHSESFAQVTPEGLAADLMLKDVEFTDGRKSLLGVRQLSVERLALQSKLTSVRSIRVIAPHASVLREADGSLVIGGLKMRYRPMTEGYGADVEPVSPRLPAMPPISSDELVIKDARIDWTDRAFVPAVETSITSDVSLVNLRLGQKTAIAKLAVRASIAEALAEAKVDATVQTWPDRYIADCDIDLSGLRVGALAAYLPQGLASNLNDGRMKLKVKADLANNSAGGLASRLEIGEFELREANAAEPLVAFESFRAVGKRIDPAGLSVAMDEVSMAGLVANIQRTAAGDLAFAGVRTTRMPSGYKAVVVPVSTTRTAMVERGVGELVAAARRPMTEISIEKLSLSGNRIRFTDLSRPSAVPLVIEQLHLRNADRLVWLGKDAMNQPPNRLELSAKINPIMENLVLSIEAQPFASQSTANVRIMAQGIHGKAINQLVPELIGRVDGSTLENGRFEATLDASARIERRSAAQLDFRRGFDFEFGVRDILLSRPGDKRPLLGLKEIRVSNARIEPAANKASIGSIEISKPIATIWREKDGMYVAGCRVILPQPGATATTAKATATAAASVAVPVKNAPAPAGPSAGSADISIRKLLISGIDVLIEDRTCDPRVVIPLDELDVQVADLGTRTLQENRPVRFSATLGSGKVSVPWRSGHGHAATQDAMDQRDLFAIATANGAIALYPEINGWVRTSMNGLELAEFRGLAAQFGVELRDGIFDNQTDIRIRDSRQADVRLKAVLTDLSVSEPASGPLTGLLRLPMPLDAAIGLVQDADGSVTLPASFTLRDGQVTRGQIFSAAMGAVSQTLATAIASSPLKLAGGLWGQGHDKPVSKGPAFVVAFAPGQADLDFTQMQRLQKIVEKLRDDRLAQVQLKPELSESDVSLAGERANPNPQDAMDMIRSLRAQKSELMEQRREMAVQLRTQLAAEPEAGLQNELGRLRQMDRQILSTEDSLDKVLDLLRPGADRQAGRRTRGMAIDIGEARVRAIRAYLLASGLPRIADRIFATTSTPQASKNAATGQVEVTLMTRKR